MRPSRFAIALAITFFAFLMMMGGVGALAMVPGSWMMSRMLFPLLLVGVLILFLRPRHAWYERRHAYDPAPPLYGTPEEILRQRFARGELTRDRYQESIIELLKDRYVTGELTLGDYEARVSTLIGDARPRRLEGEAPRES